MASRLNLSGSVLPTPVKVKHRLEESVDTRQPVQPIVTPSMVDAAVESVIGETEFTDPDKEVLRKVMSVDDTTDFAQGLQRSALRTISAYPRLKKKRVVISYVLDQSETADLSSYAPEFDLHFTDVDSHDHAMAASLRVVDTDILMSQMPQGIAFKDVGGRPLYHISNGNLNAHMCNPISDSKDPSRLSTRALAAKRIALRSKDDRVIAAANRFLTQDETFVCRNKAQDCYFKTKVSMSSHVYDIPIHEWPQIMGAAGSSVHFGCLSFPMQAFDTPVGEMKTMRARYEVDLDNDTYNMGFVNSPSWWYTHKWSQFMRYAADQELVSNGHRFSYKIIERRGDTIFFRIIRLEGSVSKDYIQHYAVPGVKMVRVEGFSYDMTSVHRMATGQKVNARPTTSLFPARLWTDMLTEAMLRFERGDFTYDKMYNYYRTVSARHTINAVLISGGQKVGMEQVVNLIVRSGLCAAAKVMLEQRTSRALTTLAMQDRLWFASSGLNKMLQSFISAVKSAATAIVYYPVIWLSDKLLQVFSNMALDELASWEFEPEVKEYPFSSVLISKLRSAHYGWVTDNVKVTDDFSSGYLLQQSSGDHDRVIKDYPEVARMVLETVGVNLPVDQRTEVQETATSWSDDAGKATTLADDVVITDADQVLRKNAIRERLEEGKMERDKIKGICNKILTTCMDFSGVPNLSLLKQRSEEYDQPDIWFVSDGVIQKSALGLDGTECRHSAVYTLQAHDSSNFRVVRDEKTADKEFRVLTTKYTGWALTTDRLLIFNGPEIERTLELALNFDHNYIVELQQGPPGCGKTRDLLATIHPSHVAMCPVRESATDTRQRLVKDRPDFPDPRNRISTVHSYLCNFDKDVKSKMTADVLQADEVYMTHSAEWYAAAALLGVSRIRAYGDLNQIPHVPRVQASKQYLRIQPNIEKVKYDIYRCPADALAAWGHIYDWRIRTHSTVSRSITILTSSDQRAVPDGCVFLCMYQSDKKELKRKFVSLIKPKSLKIMTVHESEGKTFKDVWLFRMDTRVRSDKSSLYDKSAYALVAMSRHTHSFAYIRPKNLGDCVDVWSSTCQDVRAIAAMSDVSTVGISMRYK